MEHDIDVQVRRVAVDFQYPPRIVSQWNAQGGQAVPVNIYPFSILRGSLANGTLDSQGHMSRQENAFSILRGSLANGTHQLLSIALQLRQLSVSSADR